MERYIDKIIISVLKGKDYRPYVLATINKRFVDNVYSLLKKIIEAREKNKSPEWWINELVDNSSISKKELLWFVGLNNKTVTNMANTAKREVCIDLGKENIESIKMLSNEIEKAHDGLPYLEIKLKHNKKELILTEQESLLLLNTISAMKLTIQGGAWSDVGKKVEKKLLFSIFELLGIPSKNYVLVSDEMKRRGFVGNREIDGIIVSDDGKKIIQIEFKLLGIGNPEIGDEALAREVCLFLVDRMTTMMIEEGKKKGVNVIELRDPKALEKIHEYLKKEGFKANHPPKIKELDKLIPQITKKYNEDLENKKIILKAKELTK